MDDLISRSALLAEYDRVHVGPPGGARKLIEDAPSAQRKGKWVRNNDSDHAWKCSVCGCGYTDYRLNYCYDCGADMKGEEDDERRSG